MVPPSWTIFFPGGQFGGAGVPLAVGALAGALGVGAVAVVVAPAPDVLLAVVGVQLAAGSGDAFAAFVFLRLRRLPLVAVVFSCPPET